MIFGTFFFDMIVANDMSLITFLPLTYIVLHSTGNDKYLSITFILQTIAANMGGMITPYGNPQNLYLYIKIILTGDTLEELWKTVHPVREGEELKRGMRRFDRALEEIGCDYLFVPSNREGVAQLEIMKVWRYREKIAEALGCNTDKQSNLSECDGFKDNHPYIIAIDFNIKRILRALKQIEKYDAESEPRICCFPFQKKTMFKLLSKYDAPKSLVVTLDKNNIYDIVLGSVPKPPKQKPYMTKESEYITATITATHKELTDSIDIEVKPIDAESIEIVLPEDTETNDDGLPKIKKGSKIQLEAEIEPESTTYKDIVWSVSDETIATVDENGVLNANSTGTITVTATAKSGVTEEIEIEVYSTAGSTAAGVGGVAIIGAGVVYYLKRKKAKNNIE